MKAQKLIVKLCYDKYWDWLQECESEGIRVFGDLVDGDRDMWITKYKESMQVFEQELQEWSEYH